MMVIGERDDSGDRLPEEPGLTRLYRAAAREVPPASVDERIRAAARAGSRQARGTHRSLRRWVIPASIAAMLVLSLGVVLQTSQLGLIENKRPAPAPEAVPPETAPALKKRNDGTVLARPSDSAQEERMVREKSKAGDEAPASAAAKEADGAPSPLRSEPKTDFARVGAAAAAAQATADVVAVRVSGSPGTYYFAVTVRSPDAGCARYADWWEVVAQDGRLLYRRVLLHSHTDEQPFERSGGPVPIEADTVVWVRAHMSTTGYGGAALKGSVAGGFEGALPAAGFAAALEKQPPLPDGCAF